MIISSRRSFTCSSPPISSNLVPLPVPPESRISFSTDSTSFGSSPPRPLRSRWGSVEGAADGGCLDPAARDEDAGDADEAFEEGADDDEEEDEVAVVEEENDEAPAPALALVLALFEAAGGTP